MKGKETEPDQIAQVEKETQPHRIRLPGFVGDEDIGLGTTIKRATSALGIQPCGGCDERAAWLNQRFVFSPWNRR